MNFDFDVKPYAIGAGATIQVFRPASFFQLMGAPGGAVTVHFLRASSIIGQAQDVTEGFSVGPGEEAFFDGVEIYSATSQTLQLCFARGAVDLRKIVGAVSITNVNGGVTQVTKTVTNASGLLLAANVSRRFLMIQNKHATGNIFLNIAGAAAVVADGYQVESVRGSLKLDAFCPTGAIYAIGDIASNANIIVSEG